MVDEDRIAEAALHLADAYETMSWHAVMRAAQALAESVGKRIVREGTRPRRTYKLEDVK